MPAELRTFLEHPDINMPDLLRTAVLRTSESWLAPLRHLPAPVRFRASGALRAWLSVFWELPGMTDVRSGFADPVLPLRVAMRRLAVAVTPLMSATRLMPWFEPLLQMTMSVTGPMVAFWLRAGVFYEPTQSLGALLGGTDLANDLPLQMFESPEPALCIVPPWQRRLLCADADSIMLFQHAAPAGAEPAVRALTVLLCSPLKGSIRVDRLTLHVADETLSIRDMIACTLSNTVASPSELAVLRLDGPAQSFVAKWETALDYVVKVLLYLQVDAVPVRELTPYGAAPKEFPGLGRRKRELRLAEVEQLYDRRDDRRVVGPASLAGFDLDERDSRALTGRGGLAVGGTSRRPLHAS